MPCIMAEPTPCSTRLVNSSGRLADVAVAADPSENIHSPMIISRFLPIMSANLPIGSRSAASVNRYAIKTHCTVGRSDLNSFARVGITTLDAPLSITVPNMDKAPISKTNQA